MVVKHLQLMQYMTFNSKLNLQLSKFWNLNPPKINFENIIIFLF